MYCFFFKVKEKVKEKEHFEIYFSKCLKRNESKLNLKKAYGYMLFLNLSFGCGCGSVIRIM
jgi:hypothetical protein